MAATTRLTVNRHPLIIDHDTQAVLDLVDGETLHDFLHRHIENLDGHKMAVFIGGVHVPAEHWRRLRVKNGQNILVRSTVHKTALLIVALVVLTIFTAGAAAAIAGAAVGGGAVGAAGAALGTALVGGIGATAASIAVGAIQVIGALVINKVLGPRPPKPQSIDRDQVYTLGALSNSARQYEPASILFGEVKVTPDYLSLPYYFYRNNDQYMSFILTPGLNVASYEDFYFGETALSTYQEVSIWRRGFTAMADQVIPVSTNVDSISGGVLQPGAPVVRTTNTRTRRVQIDISYLLFDLTSKGKKKDNQETVRIDVAPVAGTTGTTLSRSIQIVSREQEEQRRSYYYDVIEGQYDVTVRRLGLDTDGSGATCEFTWTTLTAYQADDATYDALPQIAFEIKASGQINGTPDKLNSIMRAQPIPYWNGSAWVTATTRENGLSNPGANALKYLRGYYSPSGKLIAGMGLDDDMIDIESLKAFMEHCDAWSFKYDAQISSDRNHEEFLAAICAAGMGEIDFAPGRATALWSSDEQGVEGIVNMANIKRSTFQINYTLAQAADGMEITWFDRTIWDNRTLRIPSPGVIDPINYAPIALEGIGDEAQAAIIGRFHMAQMLYQSKDINYGTDLEHLAYRRKSMIQLQHDLTQWGFGGRVRSIMISPQGVVSLYLDEPVPPPSGTTGYIGLRMPTEIGYRVFRVTAFAEETRTLQLIERWPGDIEVPEDPNDIIWIYDFKSTPGYRCRVVSISPDDNLTGATVAVVPESDEYWNYIRTGNYVPPSNQSLLNTRPIVSNLRVGEERVVQGDTVFVRLYANWDVTGPADRCVVYCAKDGQPLLQVAETDGRSARWRIDDAGVYVIAVRAYRDDGFPSTLVSTTFTTTGADIPPVNVDVFDILQLGGGVRQYTWEFDPSTIESPDLAGVVIRYVEGNVLNPVWESMKTLLETTNDTGYHAAPFVSTQPPAGVYTFALRSINTSGTLSTDMFILHKTLANNLGEVIDQINEDISQAIVDAFNQTQAEAEARAAAIAALTEDLQDEVEARIVAVSQEATTRQQQINAQAQALIDQKLELEAAIDEESEVRQSADESLALQISQLSAGTGTQFDSKKIWYFDTNNEGWTGTATDGYLNPGAAVANSPTGLGVVGTEYRYLKMRVKRVGNPAWLGYLGWRPAGGSFDSTTLTQPVWDADGIGVIDMDEIAWSAITIDQIRLQLPQTVSAENYFLFDWIAIGRPTPGASVAMVQDERQARIAGDAAEASARQTLAAQMRGDYTGTDVAQVTQGIIASERNARVSGDEALAEDIVSLTAQMDGKASAEALQQLTVRVENTEAGLESTSQLVTQLTAQLTTVRATDTDVRATSTRVRAANVTVYSVIANADYALSEQINAVSAEFGSFQAAVNLQIQAISNETSSLAQQVSSLSASLAGKADSSVVTAIQATVTQQGDTLTAQAQQIGTLTTQIAGKADASIVTGLQTTVTQQGDSIAALSNSLTQVSASVAGKADASVVQQLTATVTAQGNTITAINAQYFLSVNVNGYIGGMKIGNNGNTVVTQFLSDAFVIVSPTGGLRTEYSSGNWRVYDDNGTLRTRMGVWN